ncbi:DUF3006 domain-containing protein [Paenisporosarcina sp. TG20]|uniref:DUF3006 domain-containing protein n=1 Tax=Paenisporosarcina sp. TG20 TaxID=1211706 RepID=UPI0002DF3A85|nr:DUF3006 domain-containing protein [Paenisporosarcina sp. TG20]
MTNKGVLDRIEEGKHAVILVDEVGKEFIIQVNDLPEGSKVGMWFDVEIINNDLSKISINMKETTNLNEEITNKVNKLKEKGRGSRFKRN